jgi:hypothetical protein
MQGERTREEIREDVNRMRDELLQYAEELEEGEFSSRQLLYYPILDADVDSKLWESDPDFAAHEVREQIENASTPQVAAYHAYASMMLEL